MYLFTSFKTRLPYPKSEIVEKTLVGSRVSDIRQRNDFILDRFFWNKLKQGLFIVVSAKKDSIRHFFPGNKPIIESFKGGGGVG